MTVTSLNEVRTEVVAAFKAVHDAYYPSTLVNYPDFDTVDLENQETPFVALELDLTKIRQAAMGDKELTVPGGLIVYYYYRPGAGLSGALMYTDMLNTYIGMSQIGSFDYSEAVPIPVTTFPGWQGSMNTIRFNLVSKANCQDA